MFPNPWSDCEKEFTIYTVFALRPAENSGSDSRISRAASLIHAKQQGNVTHSQIIKQRFCQRLKLHLIASSRCDINLQKKVKKIFSSSAWAKPINHRWGRHPKVAKKVCFKGLSCLQRQPLRNKRRINVCPFSGTFLNNFRSIFFVTLFSILVIFWKFSIYFDANSVDFSSIFHPCQSSKKCYF